MTDRAANPLSRNTSGERPRHYECRAGLNRASTADAPKSLHSVARTRPTRGESSHTAKDTAKGFDVARFLTDFRHSFLSVSHARGCRSGFTLIELLLICVFVIGIVAAVFAGRSRTVYDGEVRDHTQHLRDGVFVTDLGDGWSRLLDHKTRVFCYSRYARAVSCFHVAEPNGVKMDRSPVEAAK